MSSKKRANLKDQKTGLSLNPFWFTHYCPEDLAALKNSYPKDDEGNVLQLLHDSAIDPTQPDGTESYNVEIACCQHDMNGLLKDKATTNAYIWGRPELGGTLWYNDLTNKKVGPLDITVSETVDTADDDTLGFRTVRKLNFTNPNYFDLTASWKLYEWQKNISFKRKQYTVASQTDYYLESNPVEFACKEPIKKNSTYRIYYSNLTCDFVTVETFGLNLRVEVSKDNKNWVPVKVADGSSGGVDLIIWAEDQKISEGYVDVMFEDEYAYVRIKQCWDGVVIPGAPNTGTGWHTGGGGQPYPYIKAVNFGFIPLVTQTPIIDNTQKLGAGETASLKNIASEDINLNGYLELNKETSFEYQASVSGELFNFLESVNTIINKQETELKTTSILRVNAPIITHISSSAIVAKCTNADMPTLNFLPGHELSQATLCLSKESTPNENPLRKFILNLNQLSDAYTFDVEPNNTYYLYTIIKYLADGNLNTTYSDVVKFKTEADNTFKIKFCTDRSKDPSAFWNDPDWNDPAYETDNTTVTIARGKQLIAWTQEMPFYHPTTTSYGYFVEIDITNTLLKEVTAIDIEGTLSYPNKDVKCLLQNDYVSSTGKNFWSKEVGGKTVYGKSFKYTYGGNPTDPGDSFSYTLYYYARDIAGHTDNIKITIEGKDVEGNTLQYTTTYPVLAPMARANRD